MDFPKIDHWKLNFDGCRVNQIKSAATCFIIRHDQGRITIAAAKNLRDGIDIDIEGWYRGSQG